MIKLLTSVLQQILHHDKVSLTSWILSLVATTTANMWICVGSTGNSYQLWASQQAWSPTNAHTTPRLKNSAEDAEEGAFLGQKQSTGGSRLIRL